MRQSTHYGSVQLIHVSKLPPNLENAPVTITVDLPGKGETTFRGKVVFVSPEVSPVNGLTRVWAEIDNSAGLLRPGLRPRMTVQLPATAAATKTSETAARPAALRPTRSVEAATNKP